MIGPGQRSPNPWCCRRPQTLKYIHFRNYPSLELALTLLFAYFPYVTAEGVGLSGTPIVLSDFGPIIGVH